MSNQTNLQRRQFLQKFAVLAGGSTLLATQTNLHLIKSALAAQNYSDIQDHKSLVCIYLAGGNDGFNMFIPHETAKYNHYNDIRQALAIPRNEILETNTGDYGFNPNMLGTRDLYNDKKLALISNVGNLFQPLTRKQYKDHKDGDASILVPPSLFSHSHQSEIWQTNNPPVVGSTPPGWAGLLTDLLADANQAANLPAATSLSGTNPWQSGIQTQPLRVGANGLGNFQYLHDDNWPPQQSERTKIWNEILNLQHQHALEKQTASGFLSTQSRISELDTALANAPALEGIFPEKNSLANKLKMIARLIAAREDLGLKRQIFFVRAGAWDTHGNQKDAHAGLLKGLNDAISAFYEATDQLGKSDTVTTFTASEFGRSSTSNGDGTDHGWGGHQLVMGGAVKGGKVHGKLPDMTPGGADDSDDAGRLIPTISVDQYGATLAKWMGVTDNDLNNIFPNLNKFAVRDLEFMN